MNSVASNYDGSRTEHWGQDYSQLGRISIGSGQDCCRLGAGFPSTRGRIPVDSGQDSRQPGARDSRRLGAGFPVSPGQDFRRLGAGSRMKGEGRRVNSGASNYGGSRTEHWEQDYSQLGRISIGSGQDCCRLGAGFPSARGRIPVDSGQDSRQPGARDPRRLGAGFPVSPGQDSRRLGEGSSMKGEGRRVNSGASNYGGSRNEYYSIVVAVGPSPPPPPPPRRAPGPRCPRPPSLLFGGAGLFDI